MQLIDYFTDIVNVSYLLFTVKFCSVFKTRDHGIVSVVFSGLGAKNYPVAHFYSTTLVLTNFLYSTRLVQLTPRSYFPDRLNKTLRRQQKWVDLKT